MLNSIEVEIDEHGYIHSKEPLPTGRLGILTLFEQKPPITQFNETINANHFDDLFGILTATRSVSLEEMEQAILQQAQDDFNDCN
jgi:hypothetical protein